MRIKNICIFFACIMLFEFGASQPELKIIGRITSADGLLKDGVKYIYKDSRGFMWFTFETGFQRWDGRKVKNYSYTTDTNVNNSYRFCRPILEDENSNFFIGTLHNGLIKLDRKTDTYTWYQHDPDNPDNSMLGRGAHELYLDTNGIIWLGTFEGLTRFDPVSERFQNFVVNPDERYDPRNVTRSMLRDSRGVLWVATANGLYQLDEKRGKLIHKPTEPELPEHLSGFRSILEDRNGTMWFGSEWGLFRYQHESDSWTYFETNDPDKPEEKTSAMISCMIEYIGKYRHEIWIGTPDGLKVMDLNTLKIYPLNPKNGYDEITNTGPVQYLFLDENNILWASLSGLILIDLNDRPFEVFNLFAYPDSLNQIPGYCYYQDDDENIWIGSKSHGVYQFDSKLNFIANYKACNWNPEEGSEPHNNMVSYIYEDPKGRIWMNAGPTYLCIFDIQTKEYHPIEMDVGSYKPGQMLVDPYDVVWVAAHDGLHIGSLQDDYTLNYSLYDNPSLPKGPVDHLWYDSKGRFWVITRSMGIYCLHPQHRDSMVFTRYLHQHYRKSFTLEYNSRNMIEDDDGGLWFCSGKEIFYYDPVLDSIVPDNYFNKNYNCNIYAISRDKNGIFWFVIRHGIVAYNPEDSLLGAFRVYDHRTGLPFSFVERSTFFRDKQGYMYQGGSSTYKRGFFRFHPDSIPVLSAETPPLVLTEFNVMNKPYFTLDTAIIQKKHIDLSYQQNFFSFEFNALDHYGPEFNNYAFMLEGLDNDWIYVENRTFANYTGVPPGNYVFKVRNSLNGCFWFGEETSVSISISPPPWKTWWAYTLYGLTIIILIVAWRRYDLKRHRLKKALEIEQVEAEKLKELDSMKSRFFANISHEFRTPLTLILGPLEKLIRKTEDPVCVKDLSMMQRNAKRLQRLINQLLNLSKLEAGEMKLIAGRRNIVGLVRGYVHSFESLAKQKNIKLQFTSDDEKILIYVDNDKIEKILYNLLSNAFKFTPEGGEISVSVLTHPVKPYYKEGAKDGVNIIVADTGPGIPPDKVKRVFDRFYRVEDEASGDTEGTGIGLSLVQELVKLHHGIIKVESKKGKGTTFIISLPKGYEHLKPGEIDEKSATVALEEVAAPELEAIKPESLTETIDDDGKPIILVVEDNHDLRSYIRSYLEDAYSVHEAVDGEMGLKSAINKIPDLVISDVMMPKMDGYRLCKVLKEDERTSHIPVILLTAKAAKEDKLEGLGLGADDFLTKPFDPEELLVRIRNLIEQRRSLRQKYLHELKLQPESIADEDISMDKQFLVKARKVVQDYISDTDFNVETFGEKLAMSRMQLHRKITALTGQTAGEFIRNLRLLKAAELIRSKTATIAEIAYDTGFNSPSYFTDCFKKYFGKSPSEYQGSVEG